MIPVDNRYQARLGLTGHGECCFLIPHGAAVVRGFAADRQVPSPAQPPSVQFRFLILDRRRQVVDFSSKPDRGNRMGSARVSRAVVAVPATTSFPASFGGRKQEQRGFLRDAENHTPEACAPQHQGYRSGQVSTGGALENGPQRELWVGRPHEFKPRQGRQTDRACFGRPGRGLSGFA